MFYNKYKNVSTYIIIFLVSSAAFAIFLLSANVSATWNKCIKVTHHQIKNNTINKAYEHKDPTNNGEQRDGKVFALIN
ncbi:DNA damage-induced cell division inhibitor SosA [Staphylococcus aureus]